MLSEIELYVRQKNLMMFSYKDEIWQKQDDSRVLGCIQNIRTNLTNGPNKQKEWSVEVRRIKEHFMLELDTVEHLIKCKNSAMRQDHLTTVLCITHIKELLQRRIVEFYDHSLKDIHNKSNNLWKWILNL